MKSFKAKDGLAIRQGRAAAARENISARRSA
jgi:hypothetical protein